MPKRKRGGVTGDSERRRRAEDQRRRRENEAAVAAENRRRLDAERHRLDRAARDEETANASRTEHAQRQRELQSQQTEEQENRVRTQNAEQHHHSRSQETEEQAGARRTEDAERHREVRSQETEEETNARRADDAERHQELRSEENEEDAALRRTQDAERHHLVIVEEPTEVREDREVRRVSDFHNNARSGVTDNVGEHSCGSMEQVCDFCSGLFFAGERNARGMYPKCCHSGQFVEEERNFPEELKNLFTGVHELSSEFLNNIRRYNSLLSFASMGAQVDVMGAGPQCFRIHGAIYHKTSHLRPDRPGREKYAQCYILDSDQALRQRLSMSPDVALNARLLTLLDSMMRGVNPYARAYKMLKEFEEEQGGEAADVRMYITGEADRGEHRRRYNVPQQNEVAVIFKSTDGVPPSNRDIVIHPRGGGLIDIRTLNYNLEPMTYVLLFPHGESGFRVGRGHSELMFYCHRVSVRRDVFNPVFHGRKLFQQYLVDSFVKVEGHRLMYIRTHQKDLRVDTYMGLADHLYRAAERAGVRPGIPVILPSTHIGSARYMQQNYQDAMAIVRDFGKPDLFLTFTCNPSWAEISAALLTGQRPHDRPDVVARVFDVKKKSLLEDIVKNQVLGVCVAHIHVIEFQKRGLPHMHLLLILADEDKLRDEDCVNSLVSAELPDPEVDRRLYDIVRTSMVHGPCGVLNPNSPCMVEGACSKGYPKAFREETRRNVGGYPLYRRRDDGNFVMVRNNIVDNRWVVPYNPYLTKKYNAHINLEACSSVKSVKYLFKYVYKGHDAADVVLEQSGGEVLRWDEIKNYLNARYVSSPEAMWRLLEKKMQDKSHSVVRLPVHLENMQPVYFSDEQEAEALRRAGERETMLTGWFKLNETSPEARGYLYSEFPYHFTWGATNRAWHRRARGGEKIISRMYSVSPRDVERFHLRLILCHAKGAQSFRDLKTFEGVEHATFKEACRARGLLQDDEEWKNCMREAAALQMPHQLRQLFAFICVFGSCAEPVSLWNEFRESLSEDFARSRGTEDSLSLVLKSIEEHLRVHNVSLASIGMPEPAAGAELGQSVAAYDARSEARKAEELLNMLNSEQRVVYDAVLSAVGDEGYEGPKQFCVNAFAGSGKTFLFRTVLHAVRGMGFGAVPVAYTGIAAVLLEGGRTAHSAFKLPIPLLENSSCRVKHDSPEALVLKSARLFVWDECTMTPHHALEAVDRLLRDLTGMDAPFGGKVFLLGGDWRQTLPVVRHGSRAAAIESCLKNSPLWPIFEQFSLIRNMRLQSDEQEFSEWLLKLGNGELEGLTEDVVEIPPACVARRSIVDEIFGTADNFEREDLAGRAILCPKNDETLKLNDAILSRFPGRSFTFFSADSIVSEDPEEQDVCQMDFVHSLTPSGMPPHCLNLKEGAIVMLLRNLNASVGLCNGTRLIIKKIMRNFLDCEVVTGQNAGSRVFVPRTELSPSDTELPFKLIRRQFPVRLAFAMTINKSQGQTLRKVGIFLPRPVFSHGMLYVAFSRTTSMGNIRVSVTDTYKQGRLVSGSNRVFTENVVFREVLQ